MGWEGEIYFRGTTGQDPQNRHRHWICLDDDYLRKYTDFNSALFQLLEVIEILTHEFNHVSQDLKAGDSLSLIKTGQMNRAL